MFSDMDFILDKIKHMYNVNIDPPVNQQTDK